MKTLQMNKALFMGNTLFGKQEMDIKERVAMKKQQRQKEAMKVVMSTHKMEKEIDDSIEGKSAHIEKLMEENDKANGFLNDLKGQMRQAKEDYGVLDDSQEQKDLELLQKEYDIKNHRSNASLTDEERKRLADLGEMTEYQKQSMELYKQADRWKGEMEENQKVMKGETGAIRSIKMERLKRHAMVDAEVTKEKMLEAASKEIIGMLKEDAKEKIDEKAEEIKEAAEEREEKKEEKEEAIEATKENKEEVEAAVEHTRERIQDMTEQALDSDDITRDLEDEVKKLMEAEKLLEEDLKGMAVDSMA